MSSAAGFCYCDLFKADFSKNRFFFFFFFFFIYSFFPTLFDSLLILTVPNFARNIVPIPHPGNVPPHSSSAFTGPRSPVMSDSTRPVCILSSL